MASQQSFAFAHDARTIPSGAQDKLTSNMVDFLCSRPTHVMLTSGPLRPHDGFFYVPLADMRQQTGLHSSFLAFVKADKHKFHVTKTTSINIK